MDRKTLHDWQIKRQLRTVRGLNEVSTWGGYSKQYVIELDPEALQRYGLTLRSVWTHCAVADEVDDPFTAGQVERYEGVLADLHGVGVEIYEPR